VWNLPRLLTSTASYYAYLDSAHLTSSYTELILFLQVAGGPWLTVPELLFEKKNLIPALQQLLISFSGSAIILDLEI